KPLMCSYFGGKMIIDEGALENVKNIFEKYIKRPMLDVNLKQAEVPDVCTVIHNNRGTAPGMWFEKDGKVFISMPGVPNEMKGMMSDYILPRLPKIFSLPAVVHRTLLTAGLGESYIADTIKDLETALPAHIKLAYLPNFGMVRLRLTATGKNESAITAEVEKLFIELQNQLQDVMVINEDKTLEEAIGILLSKHEKTVATAESCTGGYISHLITSVPGSSKYFLGGIVSYDNTIKENVLGVNADTLDNYGAVSEETVWQMATAAKELMKTDYALAVSGIMGPGGGSEEKPVGTVWVAVAGKLATITKKFQTRYDRNRNIEVTAINALNMLRQSIVSDVK
ncbi:MAG: CinA family nicotinamide mononucleotide deamidase-related protein, partial [Segetibacter sp.]|nr:CinA family nicotinamide mononucleotide deamidase-related protein [Segetibacter sp.]